MTYEDLDHQKDLIIKHLAKAKQCYEYEKLEDGSVHLKIAEILADGFRNSNPTFDYKKLNLSNSVINKLNENTNNQINRNV